MHILALLVAALVGVFYIILRARNAAAVTRDLLGVADDVRAAARRFGFARRQAEHPVDSIDDPNIAATTIAVAFQELDGLPSEADRARLIRALQSHLEISLKDAEEMAILGRWLMTECQGPEPAISRAARKLNKLTTGNPGPIMALIRDVGSEGGMTDRQRESAEELRRIFRLPASA